MTSSPPRAPQPPWSKGRKITAVALAAAVVLAAGAVWFMQQRGRAPSAGLVRDTVEKLAGNPQLKFTTVTSRVAPGPDPGQARVSYEAEAEVREPLYEPVDATAFLRDELQLDPAAWQQMRKVLSGQTAPRILELAGLKGVDATLLQTTFLHESTPAGTKLSFHGTLRAVKTNQGWQLASEHQEQSGGELRGRPRRAFPGDVAVIDDPAELKKLRDLAAVQAGVPAKVEAGRRAFLQERQAEQDQLVAALLDRIKPGTLYAGTATTASGTPVKIYLEFSAVDPDSKQASAWLHNEVVWDDRRALQGDFAFDPDTERLALTLGTTASDAVPQGGPVLADDGDWRLEFQLSGDKLTAQDEHRAFAFTRLTAADAAATRKKIEAATLAREQPLLAIVKAGTAYPGTARLERNALAEQVRLRFRRVDAHGAAVDAVIESLEHPGLIREFRGRLDAFTRQLILASTGKGRASAGRRAGLKFPPLAYSDSQLIALDVSDRALSGSLTGSSQGWKVTFPVAGAVAVAANAAGDYPAETGAYVWSAGAWVPLPRNDAKASKSAFQAIGGFFSSLGKSSSSPSTADKVADLVFRGQDPVPAVDGGDLVVLYVGALNPGRAEKYPQLGDYPALEMAPTTSDSNGNRKVALTRIASGAPAGGFCERRVPGTVDQVSDTLTELSCTRRVAPGRYAIWVNDEGFELTVE